MDEDPLGSAMVAIGRRASGFQYTYILIVQIEARRTYLKEGLSFLTLGDYVEIFSRRKQFLSSFHRSGQ
jgi:hypothetical protein